MTATRKRLIAQYGREEGDAVWMVCPECEPEQKFGSLEEWKEHMTREHGGYSVSEVADSVATAAEGGAGLPKATMPAPPGTQKPKKMSARARELNEKLNRCVALVIKHLISGLTSEERAEMEASRTAITEAFVGVEFDFEERLLSLSGKWAVLVVLALLYVLPSVPSLKEVIAKAKEKKGTDKQ